MDQKEYFQDSYITIPTPLKAIAFDIVSPDNYKKLESKLIELHHYINACLEDSSVPDEKKKKIATLKLKLTEGSTKQIPAEGIKGLYNVLAENDLLINQELLGLLEIEV